MGLEFKTIQIDKQQVYRVVCDKCGAEIEKVTEGGWNEFGEPFSQYHEPSFKDCYVLNATWGYFSRKDGQHHRAILCEDCYDKAFEGVKITVTEYGA